VPPQPQPHFRPPAPYDVYIPPPQTIRSKAIHHSPPHSSRLVIVYRECPWHAAHDGNASRVLPLFPSERYDPPVGTWRASRAFF
jgi:hypothetical protein